MALHEKPEVISKAIFGENKNTTKGVLFQAMINEQGFYYWSSFDKATCWDVVLDLKLGELARDDEEEIIILVSSVAEDDEVKTTLPNPYPNAKKKSRLLLRGGTITLRPLPFGQTFFNFSAAEVYARGGQKDDIVKKTSKMMSKGKNFIGAKADASELLNKIVALFYERFKNEDVIDARRKADFVKNGIPNAPPLTVDEQKMIEESLELVEDVASRAKRIAGTVNESVEKFLHHSPGEGAAWGMTVAKMDLSAVTLFAEVSECEERSDEVVVVFIVSTHL